MVPPDDIEALKKAIVFAFRNKDKIQKNVDAAREEIKKDFSWDSAAKKHIEIYRSVL